MEVEEKELYDGTAFSHIAASKIPDVQVARNMQRTLSILFSNSLASAHRRLPYGNTNPPKLRIEDRLE